MKFPTTFIAVIAAALLTPSAVEAARSRPKPTPEQKADIKKERAAIQSRVKNAKAEVKTSKANIKATENRVNALAKAETKLRSARLDLRSKFATADLAYKTNPNDRALRDARNKALNEYNPVRDQHLAAVRQLQSNRGVLDNLKDQNKKKLSSLAEANAAKKIGPLAATRPVVSASAPKVQNAVVQHSVAAVPQQIFGPSPQLARTNASPQARTNGYDVVPQLRQNHYEAPDSPLVF